MNDPWDQQTDLAERAVLGGVLRDSRVITDLGGSLTPDHFRVAAHQVLFQAELDLYAKGHPVDMVTLAEHLKDRQLVGEIGGYAFLATLWDTVPTSANVPYYAGIVRERSLYRSLTREAHTIARNAQDHSGSAADLLADAESRIVALSQTGDNNTIHHVADALSQACDRIDARSSGNSAMFNSVPSGLLDLDDLTAGFHQGELSILAARPSIGKTALATHVACHAAFKAKLPTFFVSLEQSRADIGERLLIAEACVDGARLRRGFASKDDVAALSAAHVRLAVMPLWLDDLKGQKFGRIAANTRRCLARHGLKLLVIDYLQLVEPEDSKAGRQEQVAAIARRLKNLAGELNIAVLALAQLNRGSEHRQGKPRLADLRESGEIEAAADTVVLLSHPGEDRGVILADVAKQRNGPIGEVTLTFVRQQQRFENFA